MNFDLTEEQELFVSSVERFTAPIDVEQRRRLRTNPNGYDSARWSELAELGLIALALPEDAGGLDGSPVDLALVAEALGKGNSPDPWLENGVLPARLLAQGGMVEQAEAASTGSQFWAFAYAERGQRYNLVPDATKARADGDGFLVSGEKTFVMGGAMADGLIVTAEMNGEIALFAIPADREGVVRRDYRLADGSIASEVHFRDVAVGTDERLDIDSKTLVELLCEIRTLVAAELLGLGQRLLDDTLAYVKEREQFGVSIGSFQALQHRLVDCYSRIEQSRSMVYRAALADRTGSPTLERVSAGAKAFVTEQADHVAREAVQMHGGMGITDELAIGHAMKRVLVLSRLFGDADTMLFEYAEAA